MFLFQDVLLASLLLSRCQVGCARWRCLEGGPYLHISLVSCDHYPVTKKTVMYPIVTRRLRVTPRFTDELAYLFVLFWIRNRICHAASTPEGGPTESSPSTQATRHPRASLFFMFPIPPYLLSCILH